MTFILCNYVQIYIYTSIYIYKSMCIADGFLRKLSRFLKDFAGVFSFSF